MRRSLPCYPRHRRAFSKGGFGFLVVVLKTGQLDTRKPRDRYPPILTVSAIRLSEPSLLPSTEMSMTAKRPKYWDRGDERHRGVGYLRA